MDKDKQKPIIEILEREIRQLRQQVEFLGWIKNAQVEGDEGARERYMYARMVGFLRGVVIDPDDPGKIVRAIEENDIDGAYHLLAAEIRKAPA